MSTPAAAHAITPAASRKHPTAILAIILVSYFMILLDNSIIFTGIPTIQRSLSLSATGLSWVQDAYTLVFGGLLLVASRIGDVLGRRRVFIAGLAVFAASSFLVGAAPTGWWLITARALQGIGAAVVAPSSLALLQSNFPAGRERNRAVAWYGATAGLGASLGLIVGGALTDWVSWRAGFFINVPIGIAMGLAALRFLAEPERTPGRFDVRGALLATAGMGALVYGIVSSADHGRTSPVTVVPLAAGLVLLVLLVVNESRVAQPIMPLRLFASRERTGAYAARMLFLGAMMGFFFFTTQFLQGVLGFSPLQAGLAFLPMTVVNFAVAMAIPRLAPRFGNAPLLAAGMALTFLGMLWLSRLGADSAYLPAVALPMVLIGVGQGLVFAPLTSAGLSGVRSADAGAASGLVNTAHQLGSSLGLAVLVAVSAGARSSTRSSGLAVEVARALTGGAVLLAVALVVVLVLIVPAGRTRPTETSPHRRRSAKSGSGTWGGTEPGPPIRPLPARPTAGAAAGGGADRETP